MHIANIFRILGILLTAFSVTMIPPLLVAFWYSENTSLLFTMAFVITLLFGFGFWLPCRHQHREVRPREGFLIVTLLWMVLSGVSALPLVLSTELNISFLDALFESVSGLTT